MKWFKENWFLLLLAVLLIVLARSYWTKNNDYKSEIKVKSDSIVLMKDQYDSLDNREAVALELLSASRSDVTSLQDSLAKSRIDNIIQKKRHAKQVEEFNLISTAEHYIDYVRWIDTISFK